MIFNQTKETQEIWFVVKYDSRYLVSNTGRVMSTCRGSSVLLSPGLSGNGYWTVVICNKSRTIHSLVAETFLGDPEGRHVNHIDGDKLNNHISNLEYVSPQENAKHAYDTGLINNKGERHGMSKFTELQVIIIREAISLGHSQSKIGRYFGRPRSTINSIHKYRSYRYV